MKIEKEDTNPNETDLYIRPKVNMKVFVSLVVLPLLFILFEIINALIKRS